MIVSELIHKLLQLNGNLDVYIEGCDCIGLSLDVEDSAGGMGDSVLITRNTAIERDDS